VLHNVRRVATYSGLGAGCNVYTHVARCMLSIACCKLQVHVRRILHAGEMRIAGYKCGVGCQMYDSWRISVSSEPQRGQLQEHMCTKALMQVVPGATGLDWPCARWRVCSTGVCACVCSTVDSPIGVNSVPEKLAQPKNSLHSTACTAIHKHHMQYV
jgi:hypothetical protein